MRREPKQERTGKKHIGRIIFLLILVIIGVAGGAFIKLGYLNQVTTQYLMPINEANRLINYLGLPDYQYEDKWGSSFTVKDVKELLEAAKVSEDKLKISLDKRPGFVPVTRGQFESVYETLINELEIERLSKVALYIYDVDKKAGMEANGVTYESVITNNGEYFVEKDYGFSTDYIGKVVDLYVSNNEIILSMGESEGTTTINNAYFSKISEENGGKCVLAYVNSGMQKLTLAEDAKDIPKDSCICDIVISNSGVKSFTDHTGELVEVKVLTYADGLVTIDGYDNPFVLSQDFNVYKTSGQFKATRSAGTLIGYDSVLLLMKDNTIDAALLTEDIRSKNIRVIISKTDFAGYYHSEVAINSDTDYTITYGDVVEEHAAGEKVLFSNGSEQLQNGPAKIRSKVDGGRIAIQSIKRQSGEPTYRGELELSRSDEGVLIINELPVEEYLYGVVPSEMPVTYETEALKAQAICARAYAYGKMNSDDFSEYGAHLDDSVATQVYNNVLEDERATFAVDDTYGIVPCYRGEVIDAFFFSTSCGATSSNSVIWGGYQKPYLLDTMENDLNDIADLSSESKFKDFIDGKFGVDFIEQDEPFYRWMVDFDKATLGQAINDHLYDRIKAMPEYILAKNSSGEFEKKEISSIGELQDIKISKRADSGVIEEMIIKGSSETILVKGQTNARALLCPENVVITKQDGSTLTGWTSLPSAYYYIDTTNGYKICGGGFGHGVGLSQNGANDLAKMGYYATEIISHYYEGVELKDMYRLMGE